MITFESEQQPTEEECLEEIIENEDRQFRINECTIACSVSRHIIVMMNTGVRMVSTVLHTEGDKQVLLGMIDPHWFGSVNICVASSAVRRR